MPGPTMTARTVALQALIQSQRSGEFAQDALHRLLDRSGFEAADRRLATDIAMGTVRHRRTLDYLLDHVLNRPGRDMPEAARLVLQCGAYQLLMLQRVPDYAVVNESVELMRRHGGKRMAGLANAVLRRVAGLLDRGVTADADTDARRVIPLPHGGDRGESLVLREPLLPAEPLERLAVANSFPDGLARRWVKRFGAGQAAMIMASLNAPPRVLGRVNTVVTSRKAVLDLLPEELRTAAGAPRQANVVDLSGIDHVLRVRLLAERLVTIEDPTAMAAVEALGVEPGQRVLDLCAAPGGKTSYIAELLRGKGSVLALDREASRLELLRATVDRLGLTNVTVAENVPARPPHKAHRLFDRVLVDVPCSNTGVLHRRAEARWRWSERHLRCLVAVQRDLLEQGARATRPGGLCVYSTCSIEPEENGDVVRALVAETAWLTLEAENETLPSACGDGGYWARLRRAS